MEVDINTDKEIQELKTKRDELRLKAHLLEADAKDKWDGLEQKWNQLEGKMNSAKQEAAQAGGDVKAAASLLMKELKEGYESVKAVLQSK